MKMVKLIFAVAFFSVAITACEVPDQIADAAAGLQGLETYRIQPGEVLQDDVSPQIIPRPPFKVRMKHAATKVREFDASPESALLLDMDVQAELHSAVEDSLPKVTPPNSTNPGLLFFAGQNKFRVRFPDERIVEYDASKVEILHNQNPPAYKIKPMIVNMNVSGR